MTLGAGEQRASDSVLDIPSDYFDSVMKTNVCAPFWLVKAALTPMRPGSSIITTSSIRACRPSPDLVHYASTKAAINTFSKALALQLGAQGIRVGATPLGRPGQPAECAPASVFLASAESLYVSGETLGVTGGRPTP